MRESRAPPRPEAKIIDAEFKIVRRSLWSRLIMAIAAILWAAAIGFAVPQAWNFATHVGAFFAQG